MVKGRIWGTVFDEYYEMEIEECDVIMAIGLKVPDKNGMVESQATALGYGLTRGDLVTSVAGGAVQLVLNQGESPEEKRDLVRLLANEINRKILKIILREVEN